MPSVQFYLYSSLHIIKNLIYCMFNINSKLWMYHTLNRKIYTNSSRAISIYMCEQTSGQQSVLLNIILPQLNQFTNFQLNTRPYEPKNKIYKNMMVTTYTRITLIGRIMIYCRKMVTIPIKAYPVSVLFIIF